MVVVPFQHYMKHTTQKTPMLHSQKNSLGTFSILSYIVPNPFPTIQLVAGLATLASSQLLEKRYNPKTNLYLSAA